MECRANRAVDGGKVNPPQHHHTKTYDAVLFQIDAGPYIELPAFSKRLLVSEGVEAAQFDRCK
jgi:hypothetical protein